MSEELLRSIFEVKCVATLYNVYKIEQNMVATLEIGDVADFYQMKVEMHMPSLAVFVWCNMEDENLCLSFKARPRLCTDIANCKLHGNCIVCHEAGHSAIEIHHGATITRCPVVKRINDELSMLKNLWHVSEAQLWRFFYTLE